jgi:hypothetical protein
MYLTASLAETGSRGAQFGYLAANILNGDLPMTVLTHAASGWTIGTGKPLSVIAGLNVLEDEGLALEIGTELKRVCMHWACPMSSRPASTRRIAPRSNPIADRAWKRA